MASNEYGDFDWDRLVEDGPYWLENAVARDDASEAIAPAEEAPALAGHKSHQEPEPHIITCPTIDSIPSKRQTSKILKCGIQGCTSAARFKRKYDLERHMKTHTLGSFPCSFANCPRGKESPFTRRDKLEEHKKKMHVTTG